MAGYHEGDRLVVSLEQEKNASRRYVSLEGEERLIGHLEVAASSRQTVAASQPATDSFLNVMSDLNLLDGSAVVLSPGNRVQRKALR